MFEPEQARCQKVTEVPGSAAAIATAAFAEAALPLRSQRAEAHLAGTPTELTYFPGMSGFPSPEAAESPTDAISRSRNRTPGRMAVFLPNGLNVCVTVRDRLTVFH